MTMQSADPAGVLEGVYVANVTPFRDDERFSIDVDSYLGHVAWLAEQGVTGVIPFGTNGEGPSVSTREKRAVLEALLPAVGSLHVVPTVAEGNLPDTLDLLAELQDLPVRAVMVLPPYYFRPVPADGLRVFYERVLAATRHPVVVYHIPKYAVPVPVELVTSLPVWGVKDSGGEAGYAEAVHAAGKGVLVGTEDDVRSKVGAGAQGAISALANFAPREVVALYEGARDGGDAASGEALANSLLAARAKTKEHSSPAVLKRLAEARHGVPMGTVRPPFVPLPEGYDPGEVLEVAGVAGGDQA
jgi:4-hydroxy-tetrahydrodipicolinate synthase